MPTLIRRWSENVLPRTVLYPVRLPPPLTLSDIDESVHIVAQMGAEPILAALQQHPDVDIVVAGRAYDPSPYAAFLYAAWHRTRHLLAHG